MYKIIYSAVETVVFYGTIFVILAIFYTIKEQIKEHKYSKEETKKSNDNKIKIDWQEMEEKNRKRIEEKKQQEKEKIKKEDTENFTNMILKHTIYKNFCIDLKKTLIKNNEVNNLKIENFFGEYDLYDGFVISSNSCDVITEIQKFLMERDIFLKIEKINYEYIFYTTEQIEIIVKNIFFENKILQSVGVVLEKEITKINITELLKSPLAKKYIKTK